MLLLAVTPDEMLDIYATQDGPALLRLGAVARCNGQVIIRLQLPPSLVAMRPDAPAEFQRNRRAALPMLADLRTHGR